MQLGRVCHGIIKSGFCVTHGALKVRKSCAALRDVVNLARKGGVCGTHGATRKSCSFEGMYLLEY